MDDKSRWNEKHRNPLMPNTPSLFLTRCLFEKVSNKKVLDIACGTGRHARYLSELGYEVDAVDLSDYALSTIQSTSLIHLIEADLTTYTIKSNHYDVIININYLERSLYPSIIAGLKAGGMVIFETFITAHDPTYAEPSNPNYLLNTNELPEIFHDFNILKYDERNDYNMYGEKVKIAALCAVKK